MDAQKLVVSTDDENGRIDRFLAANQNDLTRSGLAKMFEEEKILVNGKPRPKNYKLKTGDEIEIITDNFTGDTDKITVKLQDLSVGIVYEDEFILVVNKPKGMIVHPSAIDGQDTMVNALLFRYGDKLSDIGAPLRPGIVHRIDKDTSGLLVVARTNSAHRMLAEQVEAHTMTRKYEGIVCGNIKTDEGTVNAPIDRHPVNRTKKCVRASGRGAVTHYRVISRFDGFTHVQFQLETGRMHQIRVHMAHIGHPVAGDEVYGTGRPVNSLRGQCLHAKTLGFTHPETLEYMEFTSDLPEYFTGFISLL